MARTTVHPYLSSSTSAERTASPRGFALNFFNSRTLAGMLLAATLAALLVVADQLVDTRADGHLLAVWVALWTILFAAVAVSAQSLRQFAETSVARMAGWSQARASKRADAVMLRLAQQDHRIMRDLQFASLRSEYES